MEAGTFLGPYKILKPIGEGGMGEVYLAEDIRLGRKVALKILPDRFAADPERLTRFEREARAAAALNHPHIAALYDVGEADGVHFLVEEHLKGDTLRAKLQDGPLAIRRTLGLAVEIAEALASAHQAGIVHRDLKPANVFVTTENHAKLLDFGLAKLVEPSGVDGEAGSTATTRSASEETTPGQVLGTVGYMAPEQVLGRPADHRADLFAFGCVLYEMVVGRRPFRGRSRAETMSQIVRDDAAPLTDADGRLPEQLQWILDKCLAKDVGDRYQDARDLAVDLRALHRRIQSGGSARHNTRALGARSPGLWLAFAGLVIAALVGIGVAVLVVVRSPEPPGLTRFVVTMPEGRRLDIWTVSPPVALSPDGSHLAYIAVTGSNSDLYLQTPDDFQAMRIPGTRGARAPFFSQDGQWIGFFARGELRKVPVAGGEPQTISEFAGEADASWGPNNMIVLTATGGSGLCAFSPSFHRALPHHKHTQRKTRKSTGHWASWSPFSQFRTHMNFRRAKQSLSLQARPTQAGVRTT